jgi:hypothetical protein
MIDPSDAVIILEGPMAELERTFARLKDRGVDSEILSPGSASGGS